jgi:MFS transporter, DHA1 family, multidrug resistance protein
VFEAFPVIFIRVRNFTVPHDGLVFIGVGIGSTIATLINIWFLRMYPRLMVEWRGFPPPEMRLYSGMVGGPLLVVSIFWLGWTGNYQNIPWYVPALSTIPLGMSIALVFMSFMVRHPVVLLFTRSADGFLESYLIDTYLMYSASALAANMIVRSAVGAIFPLFTGRMFEEMGINWASTLIGGIAFFLAPMPFVFYKYGPWIRQKSRFAPCVVCSYLSETVSFTMLISFDLRILR